MSNHYLHCCEIFLFSECLHHIAFPVQFIYYIQDLNQLAFFGIIQTFQKNYCFHIGHRLLSFNPLLNFHHCHQTLLLDSLKNLNLTIRISVAIFYWVQFYSLMVFFLLLIFYFFISSPFLIILTQLVQFIFHMKAFSICFTIFDFVKITFSFFEFDLIFKFYLILVEVLHFLYSFILTIFSILLILICIYHLFS